jgi:hypothetical protein
MMAMILRLDDRSLKKASSPWWLILGEYKVVAMVQTSLKEMIHSSEFLGHWQFIPILW